MDWQQLEKDRENGTPGPWEKRSFQSGTVQIIFREWNTGKPDPTRDGSMYGYHSAHLTMYNIGWQNENDIDREKSVNGSRIARVPDLEALALAGRELAAQLEVAKNGFDALLDLDLIPERYRDAARQQRDEARAALTRWKEAGGEDE